MPKSQMIALSCQYILEEMALFTAVVSRGWTVDVYPGEELSVLIEIAEGRYTTVPEPLTKRKNVELKLKCNDTAKLAGKAASRASG